MSSPNFRHQQDQQLHTDTLESLPKLFLEDTRPDLSTEEVESTPISTTPSPTSNTARIKRNIQPTKRYLEYIQSKNSPKKGQQCHTHRSHQANLVNVLSEPPNTLQEALSRSDSKEWQAAITAELASLEKNKTWILTSLPSNRKPISSKWIFKIKTKADGTFDKYKARLVARGFTQIQGIDYTETFSPVVKLNSIKVLLALAAQHDLEIHQLDVKTTFLYGFIKKDIYMSIPEGYSIPPQPDLMCKLNKSLYGLK